VNLCLLKRRRWDASTASTKYPSVGAGKTRIVFSSGTTDATQTVFHTPWIEDNFWTSSFPNRSITPSTSDNQKLLIRGGISEISAIIQITHCNIASLPAHPVPPPLSFKCSIGPLPLEAVAREATQSYLGE
jgi:hypothetical protein